MDQVGLTDLPGTISIGGNRYAIVFSKVVEDLLDFIPVRTFKTDDADRCFSKFCNIFTYPEYVSKLVVYSDAHPSLISVCEHYKLKQYHPPPGRPQANSVIERKIGVALAGMRATLASAYLPNCFWNFAGHGFAFIDNLRTRKGQSACPYTMCTGHEWKSTIFICGELVFFKPAKTITKQAKTDPTFVPGIFLDYCRGIEGKFSG